jgi:pimeloyl-ACP methyl ester carboxylesterase
VLVGGHSQLYDSRQVAATVTARMPNAIAEIIPEASHDVVLWHPDELAARIVSFAVDTPARA